MNDGPKIAETLHEEIVSAMLHAQHQHGPLTKNLDRVYVILGEEFGELAKEILEINRLRKTRNDESESMYVGVGRVIESLDKRIHEKKLKLRAEAVQIVATVIHLINGLEF